MVAAESVAVILLGAGLSTRYGVRDKLAEPLDGLPLGLHAARMLSTMPFASRMAVGRTGGPDFAAFGFEAVINADPIRGMASSIRLGLARAREARPDAILIALADMPFIPSTHLAALLAAFDGAGSVIASTDGNGPMPPALFGTAHFDTLAALSGDAGARGLLRTARLVAAPPAQLTDIDTPADLAGRAG